MNLRGFYLKKHIKIILTQESVHYVKIHFENRIHWVCFIINYTRTTYAQNISLGGLLTLFLISNESVSATTKFAFNEVAKVLLAFTCCSKRWICNFNFCFLRIKVSVRVHRQSSEHHHFLFFLQASSVNEPGWWRMHVFIDAQTVFFDHNLRRLCW